AIDSDLLSTHPWNRLLLADFKDLSNTAPKTDSSIRPRSQRNPNSKGLEIDLHQNTHPEKIFIFGKNNFCPWMI
ncbi:MAG: hypothetical protein N3G75_07140, partial [Methanothrix sp.]